MWATVVVFCLHMSYLAPLLYSTELGRTCCVLGDSGAFLLLCVSGKMSLFEEEKKKKRLRQQGNPCLRELRKKFTSSASTRQPSTIKLGRRT